VKDFTKSPILSEAFGGLCCTQGAGDNGLKFPRKRFFGGGDRYGGLIWQVGGVKMLVLQPRISRRGTVRPGSPGARVSLALLSDVG
jgi:hypothetical protein